MDEKLWWWYGFWNPITERILNKTFLIKRRLQSDALAIPCSTVSLSQLLISLRVPCKQFIHIILIYISMVTRSQDSISNCRDDVPFWDSVSRKQQTSYTAWLSWWQPKCPYLINRFLDKQVTREHTERRSCRLRCNRLLVKQNKWGHKIFMHLM